MGQPPPRPTAETVARLQEALRQERREVEELRAQEDRNRLAEQARGRLPENERQEFGNWAQGLLRRGNELGFFTLENTFHGADALISWYHYAKEKKLEPYNPDPLNHDVDNKKRQEHFSRGLPPQCKRRIYTDSQGVLRSVTVCESLGSQRIYHDV